MRITTRQLRKVIRESIESMLAESDRFHGVLPQELWELSDYEDAVDTGMLPRLQEYSDEELQMKIEQLEEEIEYEKNNMDDPQNQYDTAIAPKESLINVIQDILEGLPPAGV